MAGCVAAIWGSRVSRWRCPSDSVRRAVERGLLVTSIAPGSPADSANILVGDVILAIDQASAAKPDDLSAYLTADRVGQRAALRVLRGTNPVQLDVTIGERADAR